MSVPATPRPRPGPAARRWTLATVGVAFLLLGVTGVLDPASPPPTDDPDAHAADGEAFPGSWYTEPLPDDTPWHPRAADLLAYLRTAPEHHGGIVHLAADRWAIPVHHAGPDDPEHRVQPLTDFDPPEWQALRIPSDARPARNDDGEVVVWDHERGLLVHLFDARWDDGEWSAEGGSVRYLASNGLPSRVRGHDDDRNVGTSRGNNGLTFGITWDEVQAGAVTHVVKVATGPETHERHVWPMWGSDGETTDPDAPPQGLRLRIRPDVDLEALGLDGVALVIARGLQTHGMYVGDNGGRTSIKLEAGPRWGVPADALADLPLDPQFWQVLPEEWGAPPGA